MSLSIKEKKRKIAASITGSEIKINNAGKLGLKPTIWIQLAAQESVKENKRNLYKTRTNRP